MAGKIDSEELPRWYVQRVCNDTTMGIGLFVRDCDLSPEAVARYSPGTILREPGYTYATNRIGGIPTSHRVSILSNHMLDLGADAADPRTRDCGICMADRGSRFKVLDVYEKDGKTQILLLHLMDDERWRAYMNSADDGSGANVSGARSLFDKACGEDAVEAVSSEEWLDLMSSPIGLDAGLEPWPAAIPVRERLAPMGQIGFREIIGSVLYVQGAAEPLRISGRDANGRPGSIGSGRTGDGGAGGIYPDIMAYGYLNPNAGMCVQVLCPARLSDDGEVETDLGCSERMHSVRVSDLGGFQAAQVVDRTIADFSNSIAVVEDAYGPSTDQLEVRSLAFLDGLRSREYPDDIEASLMLDGKPETPEKTRIRLYRVDKHEKVYGILLQEPEGDFGVHAGAVLPLAFADDGRGVRAFAMVER